MISKKIVQTEITSLSGLYSVVQTYKEIAAARVTRTRNSVVRSHAFLNEINQIFQQVKSSYKSQLEKLMKQKKVKDPSKLSFLKSNGKTVYIFLSANTGLYGDIIRRTFDEFKIAAKRAKEEGNHVAVVGRLGRFLMRDAGLPDPYRYFDFPDQAFDDDRLHEIVQFLIEYEKIVVYYEVFKTVVRQDPIFSDISGNYATQTGQESQANVENVKYLFEPSLEKVLAFFEKEIFAIIFEQTIRDSQLAKFASRLVSLDSSSENIKKKLISTIFDAEKLKHREKNKKQNQTFSSISLWG